MDCGWWWWWFFGRLEENGVGVMGVGREGFRGFMCVCVCVCEKVGRGLMWVFGACVLVGRYVGR